MNSSTFEMIRKYAGALSAQTGGRSTFFKIMIDVNGMLYETAEGCSFSDLKREDVAAVSGRSFDYPAERRILTSKGPIRALVLSRTPYCTLAAEQSADLVPVLDDMAQIIGPAARVVSYEEKKLKKVLKKASACFVEGRYTICAGRNLFEAAAALEVLEKSAEITAKAQVLGGAKAIAFPEVLKMRRIYLKKYSKTEAAAKAEEGRQQK